jgi:hypothetical protein
LMYVGYNMERREPGRQQNYWLLKSPKSNSSLAISSYEFRFEV